MKKFGKEYGLRTLDALAIPLSRWTFGSDDCALEVALLGAAILFSKVAGGQAALIQGLSRIGDLVRPQVASSSSPCLFFSPIDGNGAGLWVAALNVKYLDFRYIIPFVVQFGLHLAPVGFSSV